MIRTVGIRRANIEVDDRQGAQATDAKLTDHENFFFATVPSHKTILKKLLSVVHAAVFPFR